MIWYVLTQQLLTFSCIVVSMVLPSIVPFLHNTDPSYLNSSTSSSTLLIGWFIPWKSILLTELILGSLSRLWTWEVGMIDLGFSYSTYGFPLRLRQQEPPPYPSSSSLITKPSPVVLTYVILWLGMFLNMNNNRGVVSVLL